MVRVLPFWRKQVRRERERERREKNTATKRAKEGRRGFCAVLSSSFPEHFLDDPENCY